MTGPEPLHRLFGLALVDLFEGTNVTVELEVDLSHHKQLVDVILIRRGPEPVPIELPDGFDELAPFNVVTFKSSADSLDRWALCELIGHYVNYRKQSSESMRKLRPESDYRMYAVCVRFPKKLASTVDLRFVREGVWDAIWPGVVTIRIIVIHGLPEEIQNAILLLFSAKSELVQFARSHYHPHSPDSSTLLYRLYKAYLEDSDVASKLREFARETVRGMSTDELRDFFGPDKAREILSLTERLEGLSTEDRLKGLPAEELRVALEFIQRKLASGESNPESN